MVNIQASQNLIINGLISKTGWEKDNAIEHYNNYVSQFEINDELEFVILEAMRIQKKYPIILVAPLMYNTKDNKLYQILVQPGLLASLD